MLILVVVIVKTAYNGEIVDTAITATKKTQKEADKEVLQTAVVGATDPLTREIDGELLESDLESNGWTVKWERQTV